MKKGKRTSLYMERVVITEEANYALREIHKGICGNHSVGQLLCHKGLKLGYYWPSLAYDAAQLYKKCNRCQRFVNINRQPLNELTSIFNPWSFAQCGVDIIRPLPSACAQAKYVTVVIDYFTKWVKAEPLSTFTEAKTSNFIWKNIIYRFGILHPLMTDNGRQFDNKKYCKMCSKLRIKCHFSSLVHP